MSSFTSFPSVYNLGHSAISDLLRGVVLVEEKIDGSQFSCALIEEEEGGPLALKVRSKGAVMIPDAPEKMFQKAVDTVMTLDLHPGWTYRTEYLLKPKHNALAYDRIPTGHLIIFDINTGDQEFLSYDEKAAEAARLGLEVVPRLFEGMLEKIEDFRAFLETISVLGGQKIEGVVIKPLKYDIFGRDKKVLMGKFVSEAYKEVHSKEWKKANPSNKDILNEIADRVCTPARWQKATQHMREAGMIQDAPQDIGPVMKEIPKDVLKECEQEIKDQLFRWAWPHISRLTTQGFPSWYKDQLLKKQFNEE